MLKKKLIALVLITSALLPRSALSTESTTGSPTSAEIVKACDKALADQDKVISLKTKTIEAQDKVIAAQDTRITELEKSQNNIFKSPAFYLVVGVVAGAFIVRGK